jgi:ribose-phosphate pyrophosphokinase
LYDELIRIKTKENKKQKIKLLNIDVTDFAVGEFKVYIPESIRGSDAYLIQLPIDWTSKRSINDNLIEMLFALDALKAADAQYINAVIPCLPYARQDKREGRESCNAKVIATLMSKYADRLITTDLHASQIRDYHDIQVEPLYASQILIDYIKKNYDTKNLVIFSPDAGGLKRAQFYAERLNCYVAIASKNRSYKEANKIDGIYILGDIKNKNIIVVDDMVDTAGTLKSVILELNKKGAKEISVATTHPILSDPAAQRLRELKHNGMIKEVIATGTVMHSKKYLAENKDWLTILPITPLFARVIYNINHNKPISDVYLK